jgi:holliday junction DNA helicase RuvA
MIAHLRGVLVDKHPNQLIVECGGVGYDVQIPVSTYTSLPEEGREVRLRIHTHVREDALQLFGFASAKEKLLFEKLIAISGVGPRLAVTVLSGVPVDDLEDAIRSGDVVRLVRIPGVGKKTAERIVLELRDKMPGLAAQAAAGARAQPASPLDALDEDVLSALINLGSKREAAEAAVRKAKAAGAPAEFDPLFRKAMELLR